MQGVDASIKSGAEPVCSNVGRFGFKMKKTHMLPVRLLYFQLLGQDSNLEPSG